MSVRINRPGDAFYIQYLHDLSETALANDLEQFEVVNGQTVLSVLDKVDSNLHLTAAKLDIDPVSASLAGCCGLSLLVLAIALLLETRVDLQSSNKNVLVSAGVGRCGRVANVKRDGQISHARHIEFVLCVAASPQGVFWCTGHGVDENLLLVEIAQGVGQVFRRVSAVDSGCCVDATSCRLWAALARVRANWRVPRPRAHGSRHGEAAALRERALVV
jgi:hypothetical protein